MKVTHWFNVTAFGKVAENLAANVRKGSHLLVQGRLSFRPWLTKNGEPRAGAEVVLQSYEFATNSQSETTETEESPEPAELAEPGQSNVESTTDEPFVDQF